MDNIEKTRPIILVFYLYHETMGNVDIMQPFVESIDLYIKEKNWDVMALFMPTNTEERVECLNPAIATKEQMDKIDALIVDIETNFSIGDENIETTEGEPSHDE